MLAASKTATAHALGAAPPERLGVQAEQRLPLAAEEADAAGRCVRPPATNMVVTIMRISSH